MYGDEAQATENSWTSQIIETIISTFSETDHYVHAKVDF